MEKEKLVFGSQKVLRKMQNYLAAEMSMVRGIIETKVLKERSLEIQVVIASLLGTGNAILLLSNECQRFYNECVMLARGFFERITNICYLLLCINDIYERCMQHTIFRQYLRLQSNKKIIKDDGGNVIMKMKMYRSRVEDLSKKWKVEDAIREFEESRKTRFPIPKIERRLGVISKQNKHLNISLFLAYQQTYYNDASEALHGSLYGSVFHVLNLSSQDIREMEVETRKNMSLLLWQTGELFNQLIILLHGKNDIREFFDKSSQNSKTTLNSMKDTLEQDGGIRHP